MGGDSYGTFRSVRDLVDKIDRFVRSGSPDAGAGAEAPFLSPGDAVERLGLSARAVYDLAHVDGVLDGLPQINAAFLRGALPWTKVRLLARVASSSDEEQWLALAGTLTATALARQARAVDVGTLESGGLTDDDEDLSGAPAYENIIIRCARPVQGKWYRARQLAARVPGRPVRPWECDEMIAAEVLSAVPLDEDAPVPAPLPVENTAAAVREVPRAPVDHGQTGRLPSEGEAFEAMLDHACEVWGGYDVKIRVAHRVFARDGWRCTVPGCSSLRNLQDHHIVFRSRGGSNALDNRTTLCAWHHLRGVHARRVRCVGAAPDTLRFDLGLRWETRPLLRFAAGERLLRGMDSECQQPAIALTVP